MSVTLRLATPADHDRTLAMVTAFHTELGQPTEALARALAPVLDGLPSAMLYLIGPPKSPVGYALVSFGHSLGLGGPTATIAELFIRPAVRGRGMGGGAVDELARALAPHGVVALYIDAPATNPRATVFCRRLGFAPRGDQNLVRRL